MYRECIEAIRRFCVAYEEAIEVKEGIDEYQHRYMTFTIIPRENKEENKGENE